MTMIHLDTSVISELSLVSRHHLRDNFFEHLEYTNEEILLNSYQVIELAKSSNRSKVIERLNFLKTVPRKRFLTISLFDVVFQEIASVYSNGRILSSSEFRDRYTTSIDSEAALEEHFKIAPQIWQETKDMFRGWQGCQLFGKTVAAFKVKGAEKLRVRDYLKLNPFSSCSQFTKTQAIRQFDRFAHDNSDIIAFGSYIHAVERVNNSLGRDLLEWINRSFVEFHFPEKVLEWKAKKFLEQEYFLRKCPESLMFLPEKMRNLDKMYLKFNIIDLREFPSFFFIFKLTDHLKARQSNQKPGDLFDTLYAVLIPYVSLFSCDNDIYTCLNSLVGSYRLSVKKNFVNFLALKNKWLKML